MWMMGVGAERWHGGVLEGFYKWSLPQGKPLLVLEMLTKIRSFAEAVSLTLRKRRHGKREKKATIYLERKNTISEDKT